MPTNLMNDIHCTDRHREIEITVCCGSSVCDLHFKNLWPSFQNIISRNPKPWFLSTRTHPRFVLIKLHTGASCWHAYAQAHYAASNGHNHIISFLMERKASFLLFPPLFPLLLWLLSISAPAPLLYLIILAHVIVCEYVHTRTYVYTYIHAYVCT